MSDRRNEEHLIQKAVIDWKELAKYQIKDLWTLHSIPNGGLRNKATAGKLKAEGTLPGIPDLHLPVGRGGFLSLYIEVKIPDKDLSKAQKEIIPLLINQGNKVIVCRSSQEIIDEIVEYLKMGPTICWTTPSP